MTEPHEPLRADAAPIKLTQENVSAWMIAQVERELAAMTAADEAADAAVKQLSTPRTAPDVAAVSRRPGSSNSNSTVFTVRLDPSEMNALYQRAAARGLRPSVLARNLIRIGLQPAKPTDELSRAAEQLEAALAAFRAAMPAH